LRCHESRAQQSLETRNGAAEYSHHFVVGGRPQLDEAHAAVLLHEHAVRDDAVKVHVEVQRPSKALDEGDRARARRERAGPPGAQALVGEDRAQRDVERARDELGVAGEKEARPARQRPDPLAHRDARDHAIHEMGRGVSCIRRVVHEGQKPRPLQDNATSSSLPHAAQRTRANPCARMSGESA
jgi:hypothetical protein